jgi:hypothetical protein
MASRRCSCSSRFFDCNFHRHSDCGGTVAKVVSYPNRGKALKATGSFTFDLLKELAKGFIKTKIEEHTGVKL